MPSTSKEFLLFLLSSVLVSSEAVRQRRQRPARKREEELVEIVAAGSVESEGGQFGVEPSIEPLNHRWTLYYEKKSKEKRCLNERDYMSALTRVRSFQTIRAFWSTWSDVQEECGSEAANFHLFKDNIRPVWEDSRNSRGGKWVVPLPASMSQEETIKCWMSLALTLLLGEWGNESEINGAVMSVRPWGSTLCVWNRNANDRNLIEDVSAKLRELFGVAFIKYQRHQATIRRNHAEKAKSLKRFNSGGDFSSNSDSSDEERAMRPQRRFAVTDSTRGILREVSDEPKPVENLPTESVPAKASVGKCQNNEEKPLKKTRERKTSISSEEGEAGPLAIKPARFPLPEVNLIFAGVAVASLLVGSILSWVTYSM